MSNPSDWMKKPGTAEEFYKNFAHIIGDKKHIYNEEYSREWAALTRQEAGNGVIIDGVVHAGPRKP